MEEVQPYSDLLSRRRGTAKHRKPAFPRPARGADLVARAQLDIHHQAATPTAAIQKIVDLCIVLALALPPPRVIAQAVIGKERSPFKALKLHAICVEEVARHLRPLLLHGKMTRHVRSLVLNGDVRLGYSRGSLLLSGEWQDMSARHC